MLKVVTTCCLRWGKQGAGVPMSSMFVWRRHYNQFCVCVWLLLSCISGPELDAFSYTPNLTCHGMRERRKSDIWSHMKKAGKSTPWCTPEVLNEYGLVILNDDVSDRDAENTHRNLGHTILWNLPVQAVLMWTDGPYGAVSVAGRPNFSCQLYCRLFQLLPGCR